MSRARSQPRSAPAFALLCLLAAPPLFAGAEGQFDVALGGRTVSLDPVRARGGDLALSQTWYLKPVESSSAPRTLQPFLQVVDTNWAGISGGGDYTNPTGGSLGYGSYGLGISGGTYRYFQSGFTFGASAEITRETVELTSGGTDIWLLPVVRAGPGLRLGDLRLDLVYQLNPFLRNGAAPNDDGWGRLYASAEGVVDRTALLGLFVHTLPRGGSVRGEGTLYLGDFEAGAAVGYSDGQVFVSSTAPYRQVEASAGAGLWLNRMVRLRLAYALAQTTPAAGGSSQLAQRLQLSVGVRE